MEQDPIYFIIYSIPVIASTICLLITLFYRDGVRPPEEQKIYNLVRFIFLMRVLSWSLVLCYFYNPPVYARFSAVYFLLNMIPLVMLCNVIALITRTDPARRFSPIHYLVPIGMGIMYQIDMMSIPQDVLVQVYTSRGEVVPGYEQFSRAMNNGVYIRGALAVFYTLISVRNVIRYRGFIVNYSTDISKSSLNWVKVILFLMVVASMFVGLGTSSAVAKYPVYILIPISILILQYVVLCFNTCKRNYDIVWPALKKAEEALKTTVERPNTTQTRIDKEQFEAYIRKEHPYRSPSLRITDMTSELGTNRTYLSEFINSEYGINFSTFINLCRLEELERLQQESREKLSTLDLIEHVGFGSYDSYLRTKKRRDAELAQSTDRKAG